jgi:hypothetical protein
LHIHESGAREDRDPIPSRLAVDGNCIAAFVERVAQELFKSVVRELRLL